MNEVQLTKERTRLGKILREAREEKGLSQEALAEAAGISRYTIMRAELGQFWLNMKQYVMLCRALGKEAF